MRITQDEPRAAAYLRQSLDVAEGIERQDSRTAKLIELRGWANAGRYVDNDTSATKRRGAGTEWARLLDDIREGRVNVVVAVDLDRLVRTTTDLLTLIDLGVKVVTVDGEIDLMSADGEFRATMLAAMARFEVRRKSERQQRANEHRARQGKPSGGRRAFGYDTDGVTLRADEAAAVRWGYEAFLAGESLAGIAREWNRRGLVTTQTRQARTGAAGEPSPWRWDNVRAVLSNPKNAGIVRYLGEVIDVEAQWPAIVPESTYRAALAVLENPDRRRSPRGDRYLLSGLALCGVCGGGVHAGAAARNGTRGYRCRDSMGHFARMAEPIEEYVEAVVVARLSRPDARELTRGTEADADATRELFALAAELRARLTELANDYADGLLTRQQTGAATLRVRDKLAEVERAIAGAGKVDVLGPLLNVGDVAAAWGALDASRKRAVIDSLLTVRIHSVGRGRGRFAPESVSIEWRS